MLWSLRRSLSRSRTPLRAVLASFDDLPLLCGCDDGLDPACAAAGHVA